MLSTVLRLLFRCKYQRELVGNVWADSDDGHGPDDAADFVRGRSARMHRLVLRGNHIPCVRALRCLIRNQGLELLAVL